MITDFFINLGTVVFGWFLSIIPQFDDSGIIVNAQNIVTPFAAGIAALGAWLPWAPLVVLMNLMPGVYLVSLFARFLRALLGHIPAIGGNG